MINKKFIQKLKKDYLENNNERRQIISLANVVLHDSKRVIFALHRGDSSNALVSLNEIEKILIKLKDKFGYIRLNQEGSYKAGVEEYVEAKFFYMILDNKKVDKFKNIKLSYESYLGGICDLTGELVRRAINQASLGNYTEVKKIKEIISDVLNELVKFDMTGYLRTKYDQAKGNLRKIEQINYDINIRK